VGTEQADPEQPARTRRTWLWLAVAVALVVVAVAVVVIVRQSSGSTSTAATPGPFESGALPVACPGSTDTTALHCFPIGDLNRDVVKPLTAGGFRCIPGDANGQICISHAAGVVVYVWPESVDVELSVVVGAGTEPDAATGLRQITDGLRVALRLLLPHSPNAQQSFVQQVQNAVRKPGSCRLLVRNGHGYGTSCFGHPAPKPVTDGIGTAIVKFRIYAVGAPNQS
jgi:hypothetical protein